MAAFTIASAASIDPMRPFVSTSPKASDIRTRTLTYCGTSNNCGTIPRIRFPDSFIMLSRSLFVRVYVRAVGSRIRLQPSGGERAVRGDADGHSRPRSRGDRQPAQGDLQVRGRAERRRFLRTTWCSSTCSTIRASACGETITRRRRRRRSGSRGRRSSTRARCSSRTIPTSGRRTSASACTRRARRSACRSVPRTSRGASTKSRSSSCCRSRRTSSSYIRMAGTRRKCLR